MSKLKKSKSEAECGEGSSCSSNTGGDIIETCIIHFPDVNRSNTMILQSNIENPSELNEICRRRLLEPQVSVQRMTDICPKYLLHIQKSKCMGIKGIAIRASQEIYIAFKHLLSLRRNLVHHYRSVGHLLRNTFPQNVFLWQR